MVLLANVAHVNFQATGHLISMILVKETAIVIYIQNNRQNFKFEVHFYTSNGKIT